MHGGDTNELGEIPFQRARERMREAQDQGYKFHFSWFLVLIKFVSWKMSERDAFLEIEPLDPLAMKFSTLWYMNDMSKQWQSNAVFHAYYQQLKVFVESFPCMTP
jgi:hypothetical protein